MSLMPSAIQHRKANLRLDASLRRCTRRSPSAVDVIMSSVGSGRRETAMSSVHHGWFSDNKEWIEYIVAVVVLWLLMMTAVSVFDLRSAV